MKNGFHLLINAHAGTASRLGAEKMQQLASSGRPALESFDCLPPEDFDRRLRELSKSPLPILIGGGDGTIAKCARFYLEQEKPFGILPLGTMNLLARDLGIPTGFPDSIAAYSTSKVVEIDVGMVNGHPFLCCAAWGTMPESAKFREEHRDDSRALLLPRLTAYILRQMDRTQRRRVRLTLDGRARSLHTAMLVVSNNLYDMADKDPFNKRSLQEGVLGVYRISTNGLPSKVRILSHLAFGGWKSDPALKEYRARSVRIETDRKTELISVDGEPVEMTGPYEFSLMRRKLRVIVPAEGQGDTTEERRG